MKTYTLWSGLIGLVFSSLLASGCFTGETARENYARTNDAFIAAQEFIINQRLAGNISDRQYEDIWQSLVLGDALLREFDRLSAVGESTEHVAGQLRQVLVAIQPFLIDLGYEDEG